MTLLRELANFNLVQARIDALAHSDDLRTADLSFLIRHANSLRASILDHEPQTRAEAEEKIACLLNLARRESQQRGSDVEFEALLDAAIQACNGLDSTVSQDPAAALSQPTMTPPSSTQKDTVFGGSISDYVSFAPGRVSLIDTSYTYLATSQENADFYDRQQVGLMGSHVADLIGDFRFETRAKVRLDGCFSGNAQSYHHALPTKGDARILRCDMQPVNSFDGTILGALVYMTDVTEQVRRLRPSTEQFAPRTNHLSTLR